MFDNLGTEITEERNKLEASLEGDFVHVSAVIHKLLVKLNLAVETDADNGKAYIKALAENGIDDLTHKPPAAPQPQEPAAAPTPLAAAPAAPQAASAPAEADPAK